MNVKKGKPIRQTQGKLIVFEGADGIGKTTQARLLFDYLRKHNKKAVFISFPNYKSAWGKMVRRYLDGEFGGLDEVSPHLASMLYAGDRLVAKDDFKKWISEEKIVVCDRYMASNIAHQVVKLQTSNSKLQFIKWLEDLEYGENKIPKPDFTILLTIPEVVAQRFMSRRVRDIHERNVSYQQKVAKAFEDLANANKNWVVVSNTSGTKLKKIDEVHQEILSKTRSLLV